MTSFCVESVVSGGCILLGGVQDRVGRVVLQCLLGHFIVYCMCFIRVTFAGKGGLLQCEAGLSILFSPRGWWLLVEWFGWKKSSIVAQK